MLVNKLHLLDILAVDGIQAVKVVVFGRHITMPVYEFISFITDNAIFGNEFDDLYSYKIMPYSTHPVIRFV